MITPFQLDAAWRDYYSLFSPPANAQLAPLTDSRCYNPQFRMLPDVTQQIMPVAGKIEYNFTIPPGSIIWGIYPKQIDDLVPTVPFTFQLTDIELGHRLFQEPALTTSLCNSQNANMAGLIGSNYSLLTTPWPVIGEGLFTLEIWGTAGDRYFIILGWAEVTECLVA